jgi:putative ATP-dependent endonuclease of OLD family
MIITKIRIKNFKIFKEFTIDFKDGVNILVGDNETGKSTILEAIHLALTGIFQGKYLRNELTQYLFNQEVVTEYIESLKPENNHLPPPHILIEVFFEGEDLALFEGDGNCDKIKGCGVSLIIKFDDKFQGNYEKFIQSGNVKSLPIEYYVMEWMSFARQPIMTRDIPIKSALIDSSSNRYQNGSDVYISRIIKDNLDEKEEIDISLAFRKLKEDFIEDDSIKKINQKIKEDSQLTDKTVKLSIDLSSKNSWESSLMTYLDETPFHYIGKGEQCIVKTNLALSHKKTKEANILLLEEPENHLSHSRLNALINSISKKLLESESASISKQLIISTHSSFVANKLGLENIILINECKTLPFSNLKKDTFDFFKKLPGYNTLRLVLCKKALLVEGDCDELMVQKAYKIKTGKLPIEDNIDVISVGTTFLRFLEIAEGIKKPVIVITDNDGKVEALKSKYENYLGSKKKDKIEILFDETIDSGQLLIKNKPFNYNTLEPKLLKVNSLEMFNTIFGTTYCQIDDMHRFMKSNKTECALKLFETSESIVFPEYIMDAIV